MVLEIATLSIPFESYVANIADGEYPIHFRLESWRTPKRKVTCNIVYASNMLLIYM